MTTIWATTGIIACIISFWVGKHYSTFSAETISEMDSFVTQMKPLLADNEARTKEELSMLIRILKSLEANEESHAKNTIIEKLGQYYYNYTYEDDRDMNSQSTEEILKTIENLSNSSDSFARIKNFRPEE